jgi:hypothetical protein
MRQLMEQRRSMEQLFLMEIGWGAGDASYLSREGFRGLIFKNHLLRHDKSPGGSRFTRQSDSKKEKNNVRARLSSKWYRFAFSS